MHPRLSVNALCSLPQSFSEDVEMWGALGVDHVGLLVAKTETFGWDEAADVLARRGLRVSTISGPLPKPVTLGPGTEARLVEQATARRAVEFAAHVGAGSAYSSTGASGGLSWDDAVRAYAANVAPVRERAAEVGVALAIEPTNPLRCDMSFVFTLRDAIDLSRQAGVAVCADLQSCWNERDLHQTFADNVDRISLVQVSDYAFGTYGTPDRAVPGDGDVPLRELLSMMLSAGYGGVFDLEVLGPRVEAEGYASTISRSVEAMTEMLDDLGA